MDYTEKLLLHRAHTHTTALRIVGVSGKVSKEAYIYEGTCETDGGGLGTTSKLKGKVSPSPSYSHSVDAGLLQRIRSQPSSLEPI